MAYNGIIKGSRTLDVVVLFVILSATYPLLMDLLSQFDLSPKWITLVNIIFAGLLAYMRFITTGAVGESSFGATADQEAEETQP